MNPIGLHSHEDKLLEFAYGELPEGEARMLEAHVKGCQRCAGTLDSFQGVRRTMAELAPEPAPEAGLESLLAYAQQATRRTQAGPVSRPVAWWRRWVVPTASLAALGLVVVVVRQSTREHPASKEVAQVQQEDAASRQVPPPRDFPVMAQKDAVQAAPPAPAGQLAQQAQHAKTGMQVVPQDRQSPALTVELDSSVRRQQYAQAAERKAVQQDWSNSAGRGAKTEVVDAPAQASADLAAGEPQGDADRQELADLTRKAGAAQPAANADPPPIASTAVGQSAAGSKLAGPAEPEGALNGVSMRASKGSQAALDDEFGSVSGSASGRANATGGTSANAGPVSKKQRVEKVDARSLIAQADAAKRSGDRESEVQLLRQAVAVGSSGAELQRLLSRLCDDEVELGLETLGCERLMREFPDSSAAQVALRRLSSAPASPAAAAQRAPGEMPAKAKAARPMKAKADAEQRQSR